MRRAALPLLALRPPAAAGLVAVVALACGVPPDGPPVDDVIDQRVAIPAAPLAGQGVQLRMSEDRVIPVGADMMVCWVPAFVPEQDFMVKNAVPFQGASGHHIVVMKSGIPRQPGTVFDCSSSESMVSLEPLLTPTSSETNNVRILPEGFAVRLAQGSAIVVQSHYVNVADKPIAVRDVINLEYAGADEEVTEAGYWVHDVDTLDLPPGASTVSEECVVAERTQFVFLLGHMHEWGRSIRLDRARDGVLETIIDVPSWTSAFRDQPPVNAYPPEAPLVFEPGDRLTVTCTYENDRETNLIFPQEMCITFGTYFPAVGDGFQFCER